MYQVGQQVIYGIHGVCTITSVEKMRFGAERKEYYILSSQDQNSKFYVPTDSPVAVGKMQPLMTKEEIISLLHSETVRQDLWVEDKNQRKIRFSQIVSRGDRAEILSLISTLLRQRKQQESMGRKFHMSDEGYLKEAERLINAEFSHVLDLEPYQVGDFILREMEKTESFRMEIEP